MQVPPDGVPSCPQLYIWDGLGLASRTMSLPQSHLPAPKDNPTTPKSVPLHQSTKYNPKTTPHPKDNPKVNATAPKSTPQPQRQLYSPKDNPITPKTTPQLQTQPYSSKDSPTAQRQPHYLKDNPQFISSRSLVCVQALASMGDLFLQCHHCHCFSS